MIAHHGPGEPRFTSTLVDIARHPNSDVVCALSAGACRQADLLTQIGKVGEAVLAASLRELDSEGFVSRRVDPGPPLRVLYELTPLGASLATSLQALRQWASHHA
jgi:DNA-binding HxlR family transcriptional regulator